MSRSSSGSSRSKGGAWESLLFFTPDADDDSCDPIEVSDEELIDYFKTVKGTDDQILEVRIYKRNLSSWVPKWCGLWHEFTVVESARFYWSFEKDDRGLCVQRSKGWSAVKDRYRGEDRTGNVAPEGRAPRHGWDGDTIHHIFRWIYRKNYLNQGYHVTDANCHYFASELFEAIARTQNRSLQ